MSLGTNDSFYRLMCCLTNKIIESDKKLSSSRRVNEDKLCDILQAMAPTNVKTVHQTSLLHIESNPDSDFYRLPTASVLTKTDKSCSNQF